MSQQPPPRPTVVCLCGSTRFWAELAEANLEETVAGRIVLAPGCNLKTPHALWANPDDAQQLKARLDTLHRQKIDLADEILIVNPGGYIGASTRAEIAYAQSLGKPIRYRGEDPRYAVLLTRPEHPELRFGPYDSRHEAGSIARGLRSQLHHTTHVHGTTITTVPYDATLPHREPYVSTDPHQLAEQMDADGTDASEGTSFPDLYARLLAQLGYERARDIWLRAAAAYDWMHDDLADDMSSTDSPAREDLPEITHGGDFLELVGFAAKVESEGFDYACREYPPRFQDPALKAVAADRDQLEALLDAHQGEINQFWEQPDAIERYNAYSNENR